MTGRLAGLDPSLYFVTDTALCARAGRSVAETAAAAVAGGAGLVQVRDKTMSDDDFLVLARDVVAAVRAEASRLAQRVSVVLNDRVEVARRLLEEGVPVDVHVGQGDMPVAQVRRLLGPAPLIGLSAATPAEFVAARASGCVDLLGISPVFATATKADAGDALGLERLRELVPQAALPAVAIGGIDVRRAAELHGSGVVGVCAVSAICLAPDPRRAARALYTAFRTGRVELDQLTPTPPG